MLRYKTLSLALVAAATMFFSAITVSAEDEVAEKGKAAVSAGMDSAVQAATGVNPSDYPCARAGIVKLFENRQQLSSLSAWHPKRIVTWMLDTTVYYTHKVIGFFKGLMNPNALENGIRKIESMAKSANPLGSATRSIDSAVRNSDRWVASMSERTQSVLTGKVHGIIHKTTEDDGSCKG